MTQTATTLAAALPADPPEPGTDPKAAPNNVLQLAAALSDSADDGFIVQIGTELMYVLRRGIETNPEVERGYLGTSRVAHSAAAAVTPVQLVVQTDPPTAPPAASASSVFTAASDPGAIGAGNLWLQTDPDGNFLTLQLWVRKAANDGWFAAAVGSSYYVDGGGGGNLDLGFWDQISGREWAAITVVAGTQAQMVVRPDPSDVSTVRSLRVDVIGVRLVAGSTTVYQIVGTLDPSAGAGVVAGVGSLYQRKNGTAGELWLKTGAGNTAWSKVTTA